MKTKKLNSSIIILLMALFVFTGSIAKAVGPFFVVPGATDPTLLASWNSNPSGVGGTTPTTFTTNGVTWNFFNSTGPVTGTLSANWTLGSSGATIKVSNAAGTQTGDLDFSTFNINNTVQVTVNLNGKVRSSGANPTFMGAGAFIYTTGSTAFFKTNGVIIPTLNFLASYSKLVLSGTSATLGGTIIIADTLTANAIVLNGQLLEIDGVVTSMGNVTGDVAGKINYLSSSNQSLSMDQTTPGTTNVLFTLAFDDGASAKTLSLTNALCMAPGGALTPTSGTIDITTSGGSLTLLADQTTVGRTGSIGSITGSLICSSLTSQVYHSPVGGNTTNWILMGSPGVSGQNFTQWNSAFSITCLNCPNGYYPGGSAFGSITSYIEANDTYPEISNTTDLMTVGQGWWVYIGNSSPSTSTAAQLITVSGPPQTGTTNLPVTTGGTGAGYNLLANPYPSPVNWQTVYNDVANAPGTNFGSSYYSWSPTLNAHSTYDAVSNISNPSSGTGLITKTIPIGMGFYVLSNVNGNLVFNESHKLQGTQPLLRQSGNTSTQQSVLPAFSIQASGQAMTSEAVIVFNPNPISLSGYDPKTGDAKRMGVAAGQLTLSTVVAGVDLAINGMPDLTQNYSIPVKMTTGTTGAYQITGLLLDRMPIGPCLMLHDNYTGSNYDMRSGPYTITLTDTEKVARFVLNVTMTSLALTANTTQATCPTGGNAKLTAVGNSAGPWNYSWTNASNVVVKTSTNKATADTLAGLSSGVYNVEVHTVGTCDEATQTFTLSLPAMVTSAFSVTSNTVLVGNNITFTDNSVNANSYLWTFGDGNTSNLQSPVYAYPGVGTFTATFYAINATCGDTARSTQIIDVSSTTGISTAANGDFAFSKDQSGTFVKFNYPAQTKVKITLYNSLGQVLLVNTNQTVSNDKVYLNLDNSKDQLIFVSIANLDKNTQVTKKLFNN